MFSKIISFFLNRYCSFVVLDREQSIISLSRSLYKRIMTDEQRKNTSSSLRTCFWKMSNIDSPGYSYVFYVNPDWSRHGVDNPSMVYQSQIMLDPDGHMSIKALMPCVQEILSVYGIPGRRVRLSVEVRHLNGEQYYLLSQRHYKVISL